MSNLTGWFEEYKCGCVSTIERFKQDLCGYCGQHGDDRRAIYPSTASQAKTMAESSASRDPRVHPVIGDVLRKKYQGQYFESRGYITREVIDVDGKYVSYVGENICAPIITLSSWRRWAKTAKVVK